MFTLLPQNFKKDLMKEYRLHLLTVATILTLFIITLAICLFLPTFISIKAENSKLSLEEKSLADSISKKNTDDFSKTLTSLKSDLDLVSIPDSKASPIIESLYLHILPGILIQKIEYTAIDAQTFSAGVSGVAATRKILSSFAKELKSEKMFTEVKLPIANLAKETEVSFTISIKGTVNKPE